MWKSLFDNELVYIIKTWWNYGEHDLPSEEDLAGYSDYFTPLGQELCWYANHRKYYWRHTVEWWIFKPTGVAFWIGNGKPNFYAYEEAKRNSARLDLTSMDLEKLFYWFSRQHIEYVFGEYKH